MTEETYVQLMWFGIIVLGFAGALVVLAAIAEAILRRRDRERARMPWDWTAEHKRRVTDRGRQSELGINQNTRRSL